ncbi:tubulin-specific chaperone C [Neocloeon triangulifer]|uniref:tubulin-specific chaperone C n=1 Tax=Neocloeon triangulifer TaxID=2078957 RepID=UPI00286ED657|nr:tubulin-specific chaperone C [Neocloeon triangulifer]XP_059470544.1 tubulin-specific chaperone C [Neocloeon triangulifer]
MMDKSLGARLFEERMNQRENERLASKEKKNVVESNETMVERVRYFSEILSLKRGEIEHSLNAAVHLNKEDLPEHFNKVSDELQQVNRYLSDSSLYLPLYNIRKAQEQVQDLQQRSEILEEQLLPKKKFGFKQRKMKKLLKDDIIPCKIEDLVDSVPKKLFSMQLYNDNSCGFADKEDEELIMKDKDLEGKDVVLTNLRRCRVRLYGTPSTLHMTSLTSCEILVGPVSTSVFLDKCTDCTFVFACQQVRIHNNRRCNFYVHVTSRSIIEDSKEVRFAPYNWHYPELEEHFVKAGLDRDENHWHAVDDFNWLALDVPSPNWSVIEEPDRVVDWR